MWWIPFSIFCQSNIYVTAKKEASSYKFYGWRWCCWVDCRKRKTKQHPAESPHSNPLWKPWLFCTFDLSWLIVMTRWALLTGRLRCRKYTRKGLKTISRWSSSQKVSVGLGFKWVNSFRHDRWGLRVFEHGLWCNGVCFGFNYERN